MFKEVVSDQQRRIEEEENFILKLFMLIDVFEYCFKLLAVHQLQCFLEIKACRKTTKAFNNICKILLTGFQRPSFGHWIFLLRNAVDPTDKQMKKILQGANDVVTERNKLAHGVTPCASAAKEIYEKLNPCLRQIISFIEDHKVAESVEANLSVTPFANTVCELYNGRRKDDVEFLNYYDGQLNKLPVWENIDRFYTEYFNLKEQISQSQVLVLLSDYFPRDYWENMLEASVQENQITFLYGYAGVGKTMMAARISQLLNCGFYRFSSSNKETATARNAFVQFYHYFRTEIGGIPNISSSISSDDLRYYLSELSRRQLADKHKGKQYYYVFDGLDEMSENEFDEFLRCLEIFVKSKVNFLISARNKGMARSLVKVDPTLAVLRLAEMTELEVKEWIKKHSNRIRYPTPELIKAIYRYSHGNFLFLANLKRNMAEHEYFEAVQRTPEGIDAVFENMTEEFSPGGLDVILLMVVIPGRVSKNLVCAYLNIDGDEFKGIKKQILPVIKELDDNCFELFHDRYTDFIKRKHSNRIKEVYGKVFAKITKLQEYIEPLESIPDIYVEQKKFDGLLSWCGAIVRAGYEHPLFKRDRYACAAAITKALSFLLKANSGQFRTTTLPVLNDFISCNFQLLFDWRFSDQLSKALDEFGYTIDIKQYEYVDLMYSCNLHSRGDYEACLRELSRLNDSGALIPINRLRCLDYIGLTYGKMGQYENAISAFSKVIESAVDAQDKIWVGYARMNRGKVYSGLGDNESAEKDYLAAVEIRDFIANDERGLLSCLADMGNKTQARLTLAMGYENLLKFYLQNQPNMAESAKYARLLHGVLLDTYKRSPLETIRFMFTCRMLLSLAEYYQYDRIKCEPLREILNDVSVPRREVQRYNRVMTRLSDNLEHNPVGEFIHQFRHVWKAYCDGDKATQKIQRKKFGELKEGLLSRPDWISAFIARYGELLDMDEDELVEDFTIKSLGNIFTEE